MGVAEAWAALENAPVGSLRCAPTDRMTLAVVLALFLAGFTADPAHVRHVLPRRLLVLVLAVLGVLTALLRRARLGAGAVLLAQVLGPCCSVVALSLTMPGLGAAVVRSTTPPLAGRRRAHADPGLPDGRRTTASG